MPVDTQAPPSVGDPNIDLLSWDDVNNRQMTERAAVEEADAYILELVRTFAKAMQCLTQYQCQDAIDELERLPIEQQHSPWVLTLIGRACYEKLDYVKVCFDTQFRSRHERVQAPYSLAPWIRNFAGREMFPAGARPRSI
jgi:hypothetical protein